MSERDPWQSKGFGPDRDNSGVEFKVPGAHMNGTGYEVEHDQWGVWLPHSCDEWVIAASADRDECLAQLDRFIAALTATRDQLAVEADRART